MECQEILKGKGAKVWCIQHNQTIHDALAVLVEQKIGALMVLGKNDEIKGIISERDIMRVCYHNPKGFGKLPVKKVMTKCVVVVKLSDSIEHLMKMMTQNRVRHLPVVDDGNLAGIVSIGDVVKARLNEQVDQNKHLMEYMSSQ